jgi:protein TonB
MRRVYAPPRISTNWVAVGLWAVLLTLAVFLVLPLTQMVSSFRQERLLVRQADVAMEAPRELEDLPPPPVEEKPPEEPPPPKLDSSPPPLNLNIDLDIAVGSGGALASLNGLADGGQGADLLDAFSLADLEKRPELMSSVAPVYPADMRKAKVEGTVTLIFILDEEGRPEEARVERSSRPEFEKPALDAVRKWRFKPGMKDGQPVRTYMKLPLRFRIGN